MDSNTAPSQTRMVFLSHGGGPMPILGDPGHQAMLEFMRVLPARLPRPDAVVVVSAHWEESQVTLQSGSNPAMFYDYYGFPDAAYQIQYPAPGSPALAERIAALLQGQQIPARLNARRGFDHGMFIPLMMMYPQADIPCIQMSLLNNLDPGAHLALGKALRGLLGENILVVGSGFSFHNMRAFMTRRPGGADPLNDAFQDWLVETVTAPGSESEREARLTAWEQAPSARYCHPREEHLLPLHVCQGMAGKPGELIFDDKIVGVRSVGFLWEG